VRGIEESILHRKNALFYRPGTARVGDLFMSLIHTCELNGADPFDYLNHCSDTRGTEAAPSEWMP